MVLGARPLSQVGKPGSLGELSADGCVASQSSSGGPTFEGMSTSASGFLSATVGEMFTYLYLTAANEPFSPSLAKELSVRFGIQPSIIVGKKPNALATADHFPESQVLEFTDFLDVEFDFSSVGSLTPEELEVLNLYWESVEFKTYRFTLLQEFNRYRSLDFLRDLDREMLLRKLQMRIYKAIRQSRPDFLLCLETPHNPVFLATFHLVNWLGLPTLFFQPTTQLGPGLLPRTAVSEIFRIPRGKTKQLHTSHVEVRRFLEGLILEALDDLTSGRSTRAERYIWEKRKNEIHSNQSLMDTIPKRTKQLQRNKDLLGQVLLHFEKRLKVAHENLPDKTDGSGESFGLFVMQYQPERTSIPEGSEDTFQGTAIMRARLLLPSHLPLYVKEHPAQINGSRRGHLGRSAGMYTWVNALPNTVAISARSPLKELVKRATCVFTMTGTVGVEATLVQTPAIYFGNPWWAGLPGTYSADSLPGGFSEDTCIPSSEKKIRNFLLDLLDEAIIPGYASGQHMWPSKVSLPEDFNSAFMDYFVTTVESFVSEYCAEKR